MNQRIVNLRHVEILVLDEADRMLDMGFINDIRRVIAQVPAKRQTLLFSATMPQEIEALANSLMKTPVRVRVASESPAAKTVRQAVYFVESHQKLPLLEHLLSSAEITRALVFARTKRGADRVALRLSRSGITAEAIHSNKSQSQRMRALANFKAGKTRVLAASDIASRGLDVDDISHVINYDIPHEAETYVHRIGRTGRAGAAGEAISLCSADQRGDWKSIERLVGGNIKVLQPGIELPAAPAPVAGAPAQERSGGRGPRPATAGGKPGTGQASGNQGSRRSRSPEQKKNTFWQNRHKSTRQTTTSSESSGRSSHRGRGR
jgi:ATP-dependent RNA helicase RhlE